MDIEGSSFFSPRKALRTAAAGRLVKQEIIRIKKEATELSGVVSSDMLEHIIVVAYGVHVVCKRFPILWSVYANKSNQRRNNLIKWLMLCTREHWVVKYLVIFLLSNDKEAWNVTLKT